MSLRYETDEAEQDAPVLDEAAAGPVAPFPTYTVILIASYVMVALAQFSVGLDRSAALASFDKPAFLQDQEYWRILTGAALHGGLLHLAMNSYAFYSFGKIFEMITNRAHLPIVFLVSILGGGILSLIFAPQGKSVGASGGIIGLIGYLLVYAFRRREFITPEFRKGLLINIGIILAYGLLLYQVIDNYGHIGGLVAGAVYGVFQIPSDSYTDPRVANPATQTLGLASMGIYIAVCCFAILVMFRIV